MVRYLAGRLISVVFTFFIGSLILFIITRAGPVNPIDVLMGQLAMAGARVTPEAFEAMKASLMELYGLDQPFFGQYLSFMRGVLSWDLGPSFAAFPTPVTELIYRSLPWTIGLLTTSIVIAWGLGNFIGVLAGYFDRSPFSKAMESISLTMSLIPYPVFALTLMLLFVFLIPVFPFTGGAPRGVIAGFTWQYISGIIRHGFLPALSLVLVFMGSSVVSMRALTIGVKTEDYVEFGNLRGLPRRTMIFGYVMRNSMLPQVTGLTLTIGQVFGGALITEHIFGYPGLGQLGYFAIMNGDYNLLMGITFFSLIGVCIAVLALDFIYPLLDPRTRAGGG